MKTPNVKGFPSVTWREDIELRTNVEHWSYSVSAAKRLRMVQNSLKRAQANAIRRLIISTL